EGNYSLVVTSTLSNRGSDPGQVSLAAAVHRANLIPGPDTIQFSSLFDAPQTIDQGGAPITVTDPATTTIDGRARLTIRADGYPVADEGSIVRVKRGSLDLSDVTLTGGGLSNFGGTVSLTNVTVTGSRGDGITNGGEDPTVHPVQFKGQYWNRYYI